MSRFIVHTIPGSPFGRAVMATLEEKGANWALAALTPGDHKQPAHLARHPFGRIPVLEHDGFILYETQAILRYLDRVIPEPALTPADPRAAARMDQILGINDWYLFPKCADVILFERIISPTFLGLEPNIEAITEALPRAQLVFAELSRLLGDQAFMVGDKLSLADLVVGPQLEFFARAPEWDGLTRDHTNLRGWLERLEARPAFHRTVWERLSDVPAAA